MLTRLPGSMRRDAATVAETLAENFRDSRFLSEASARELTTTLATAGISGVAIYDAPVGAAAAQHHLPLVSRDRRALDTYRALDVEVELLD